MIRRINKRARHNARLLKKRAGRLFRINLANTLTLLNGISGFVSVILSANGFFSAAAVMILLGVVFDWLDGKAARFFNEVSTLGRELDSLSDLVTFGVAPAMLVSMIDKSLFSYATACLFVFSAALRLGRFNIQRIKGVFFGFPTTINGVLLPLLVLFSSPAIIFPWYLLLMAVLMNIPVRIPKVI